MPLVDHVTTPTLDNMQASPINSDSHLSPTIRTTNTTSNYVETIVPCTNQNQNQNHSHSSHNKSATNPPYPPAVHGSIPTSPPSINQTLGSFTSPNPGFQTSILLLVTTVLKMMEKEKHGTKILMITQ